MTFYKKDLPGAKNLIAFANRMLAESQIVDGTSTHF